MSHLWDNFFVNVWIFIFNDSSFTLRTHVALTHDSFLGFFCSFYRLTILNRKKKKPNEVALPVIVLKKYIYMVTVSATRRTDRRGPSERCTERGRKGRTLSLA